MDPSLILSIQEMALLAIINVLFGAECCKTFFIMLSVFMLNVVRLGVMAPLFKGCYFVCLSEPELDGLADSFSNDLQFCNFQ